MRRLTNLLVAVTGCLTVLAQPAPASAATHSAMLDFAFVRTMLDGTPLGGFVARATNGSADAWFDWTTDLCSAPVVRSTGLTFDFRWSCRRHDFAYRNLHRIDRRYGTKVWNSVNRSWADHRFLADMRSQCSKRSLWQRPTCYGWAQTFYTAVRLAGGP